MATAVAGAILVGTGPADAAAPPPAFHPYDAYDVSSWPEAVGIGDLTGDGLPDVLMSTSYYFDAAADYHLWLFAQQADGSLGPPTGILTGAAYGDDMSIEIADLDGDGDLDAGVTTTEGVEIYAQDAGGLAYSWTVPAPAARQVEAGDISGDGLADLVVRSNEGVRTFLQVNGDFMSGPSVTQGATTDIELADVTGDGHADVVTLSGAVISVFRNTASGSFAPPQTRPTGGAAPWDRGNGLAVGDLTGDGRVDVAATISGNSPNSKVSVLAQQADGTLGVPRVLASYDIPETAEAADVNNDGLTDLVVLHGGWNRAGVYLQQDDGSLSGENLHVIPYASHYNVDGLAIGDVTSDGRPDLALADYNHGLVVLRSARPAVPPPDTAITSGPSGTVRSTSATFEFSGGASTTGFECSLGDAAFAACASPTTYTGLPTGSSQSFRVRAVGAEGLVDSTPAIRQWTVEAAADLATTLTVPATVKRNTTTTYTLTVRNTGPAAAAGVTTTHGLPSGLTFQSVTTTAGTCTTTGNPATVRCTVGGLASGATVTVKVVAKATAGNNTVLTSTAVASSSSWDPDPSDDAASATTKVSSK